MTEFSYQIEPRPAALGGGWRLRLFEDAEEVGGGVFPVPEGGKAEAVEAAYKDAVCEAALWMIAREGLESGGLGWRLVVLAMTPEECDQASPEQICAAIVAQWQAGVKGATWIERLIAEGKAVKVSGSGYPTRYTACAADVLPLLEEHALLTSAGHRAGSDAHSRLAAVLDQVDLRAERAAMCAPGQPLTIEVWDQS